MRLFVAVDIGEALAGRVEKLIRELRERTGRLAPHAKVTWPTADRLHITLRFIGEVDEARAGAIAGALRPPIAIDTFDLSLEGTGAFPKTGLPRVLWAGVGRGREQMIDLEREITSRLARLGIPEEERAYNPHLTLGRIREAAGLRAARVLDGLEAQHIGETGVDAITLFQSRLSPKGPTYVPLIRTGLIAR